jgi:hypothetical protein
MRPAPTGSATEVAGPPTLTQSVKLTPEVSFRLVTVGNSAHHSLVRLSAFIRENMEQLLSEWEFFAQELLPPGKILNQAALRDDAEALLRAAEAPVCGQ